MLSKLRFTCGRTASKTSFNRQFVSVSLWKSNKRNVCKCVCCLFSPLKWDWMNENQRNEKKEGNSSVQNRQFACFVSHNFVRGQNNIQTNIHMCLTYSNRERETESNMKVKIMKCEIWNVNNGILIQFHRKWSKKIKFSFESETSIKIHFAPKAVRISSISSNSIKKKT